MLLTLCPHCQRQLNVAGLDPGSKVRCVCGEPLAVGMPRDVTVRGFTCGHCGAPVGRTDERCGHCSAGLSERDKVESLICPGCAARLPEDSRHCKSCGVELRPQAIRPLAVDANCPFCPEGEGSLFLRLLDQGQLTECATCEGLWVPASLLVELRHAATRGGPSKLGSGSSAAPEPTRRRMYVPCVDCGQLMQRRQFRHAGRNSGVVVDICKDHGVWFDRGELEAALHFVASPLHNDARPVPTVQETPRVEPPLVRPFDRTRSRGRSSRGGLLGGLLEFLIEMSLYGDLDL